MSHFAKINDENIVTEIIVAEQDFIDSGVLGDPSKWIQTSYNTRNGVHLFGGTPLRKNYAAVGMVYDSVNDMFTTRQPFPSWTLNLETGCWEPPVPYPETDIPQVWNEQILNWENTKE